jgi:hypothetical protein
VTDLSGQDDRIAAAQSRLAHNGRDRDRGGAVEGCGLPGKSRGGHLFDLLEGMRPDSEDGTGVRLRLE